MIHLFIVTNNYGEIYKYMNQFLMNKYNENIINNFKYFEKNNYNYINVKKSKIHIEFTPYLTAIDKTIILEYINPFCSILDNFFYQEKYKKIVIIYNFYLLNVSQQLLIYYLIKKFENFCDFILISNTIDNIIIPILGITKLKYVNINNDYETKKWIQIYKVYKIENYEESWKNKIDEIFENIVNKKNNLNFIYENRKIISLLFVTNININKIFIYLHRLFINEYNNDIEKICFLTELFSKYQFLIIKSTRYIIHFESLIIQIYKFIHYENNTISISLD